MSSFVPDNSNPNMREAQAQVLLQEGITAYERGNLNDALNCYMESIQLFMEIYRAQPDGSTRKADLYALMEVNLMEAEKIKAQIREKETRSALNPPPSSNNAIAPSPTPSRGRITAQSSSSSSSLVEPASSGKTAKKPPSKPSKSAAAPAAPLPDTYDFSSARKPPTNPSSSSSSSSNGLAGLGLGSLGRKAGMDNRALGGRPATPNKGAVAGNRSNTPAGKGGGAAGAAPGSTTSSAKAPAHATSSKDEEYKNQIMDDILDKSPGVKWDDIAGLSFAKQTLQEAVILPNLRPDLFTGLRSPPKGVLLFGPPGTGKTMLAKAVATESGFVFFTISASSVTSKWLGEGEKLIKALFELAREKQPSVIFIDEIDSLMSARKENEHEASRRLKTEFMTQLDGAASSSEDRILVMGATNLPWDIDEAVLRRMPKRIYVPLPDEDSRKALIVHLLRKQGPSAGHFAEKDLTRLVKLTVGYSGSDLSAVCHEAALGPIREIGPAALKTVKAEEVRPMNVNDFINALKIIRPSVSGDSLSTFQKWSEQFGVTR